MKKRDDSKYFVEEHEPVVPKDGHLYRFIKRTFDITASLLLMILLSWLILILLLIKTLEDGHRPIYTSVRVGKNGREFKFHKIRSMFPNAEKFKKKLIKKGLNEADGPAFKMTNDPRVTKFGHFLRKTSLDELPQLWDIFVGNMSFIGPRPPLPEEVKHYNSYQMHRLDVKGGLVCLWQTTSNRNSMPFDKWVALDIYYIEHRSVWFDIKIFFKAVWFVLVDHTGV